MRFITRKIALCAAWLAKRSLTGRTLDIILFQIAAVYGAADLYGYWTAGKFFWKSVPDAVKMIKSNRRKPHA